MEEPSEAANSCTQELINLPEEVIFDILLRLPLKSRSKFICVSESWLSLLSSTYFLKTHVDFSINNPKKVTGYRLAVLAASDGCNSTKFFHVYSIAYEYSSLTVAKHDFTLKLLEPCARVLGSCNGLICFRGDLTLMILNPCTGESNVFHDLMPRYFSASDYFVRHGFGYDASTEDYKVVQIFSATRIEGRYENLVLVYSLKAHKWSIMVQGFDSGYIKREVGTFANGALHWEECYRHGSNATWEIFTLDLAAKRCRKIGLPSYEDGDLYWTLGVSRGYLVACCSYEPNRADMWVMKEYNVENSWTKLVTISSPIDRTCHISPLFVAENDDEVLIRLDRKIILYNSRNGSFERLHHYPSSEFTQFQVATYFESLTSPHIK